MRTTTCAHKQGRLRANGDIACPACRAVIMTLADRIAFRKQLDQSYLKTGCSPPRIPALTKDGDIPDGS